MPRARDWLLVPLLVVVAGAGTFWGGRSTYRALRNRSPLAISCADFLAHPPDADWVRLERCEPELDNVGVESRETRDGLPVRDPTAVYIPLRSLHPATRRVQLLLRAETYPLLGLGAQLANDRAQRAAAAWLAGPIDGLVERTLDRSARDRDRLRNLGLDLDDNFVIVDHDARPRPLYVALPVLGLGLGAIALLARKWRRRRRPVDLARARIVSEGAE